MAQYFIIALMFFLLPLLVRCQTVQDTWTAPAAPDGSTSLQSGAPFTIRWKSDLQDSFKTYCVSCDIKKLDLWVTSFKKDNYKFKLAGSIDITRATTYDWDINIPSAALLANDYWVLRFTPYGVADPFSEQISSSGFYVSGPLQPSTVFNTVTAQPSVAASSIIESSYIATTNTTRSGILPSLSTSSAISNTNTASTSKGWIAGAVVGPVAGITLGAVLVWVLMSKKRRIQESHVDPVHIGYGYHSRDVSDGDSREKTAQLSEMVGDWQHQVGQQGQYPAEVAGSMPEHTAVELWHGNYSSSR